MRGLRVILVRLIAVGMLACSLFLLNGCASNGWHGAFEGMESDSGPESQVKVFEDRLSMSGRSA